jgi:Ca2+-binding EF-hand superfamily protein
MHRGMKRGMRGHGGMGMKTKLDTDKDGRISRAEAAAAPKLAERFAQMDANKDGYLDRADREAKMRERRAQWFNEADSNRDGQISRAEYDAAHARRMAERQQRMKDAPKR